MSKPTLHTYSLSAVERLNLAALLREQKGNSMTLQVIERFITDLSLTEAEIEASSFQEHEDGRVTFRMDAIPDRDFTFTEWRLSKIKEILTRMDHSGSATFILLPLFKKFLPDAPSMKDAALLEEFAALSRELEEEIVEEGEEEIVEEEIVEEGEVEIAEVITA